MVLPTVGTMFSVYELTLDSKLWKKRPIGKNREDENQIYVNDYHQPFKTSKEKRRKEKTQLHKERNIIGIHQWLKDNEI